MKHLKNFQIFERYMGVDAKDVVRIQDIIDKSRGDKGKQHQLASNMANKITDYDKAIRRGRAAEDIGRTDLADIFFGRAKELASKGLTGGKGKPIQAFASQVTGNVGIKRDGEKAKLVDRSNPVVSAPIVKSTTSAPAKTVVKPIASKQPVAPIQTNYNRPSGKIEEWPILPIGKINLKTGENEIFQDVNDEDSTLVLVMTQLGTYKIIMGTRGDYTNKGKITHANILHDQTRRDMGNVQIIGQYDAQNGGLADIMQATGKSSILGYVFK